MTALADRVKESTTTTGTGSLTLSGAVAQFESFNTAFGTTNPFYYVITDANGTDWEVGTGELSNATTLVRTTVHQSSNADAKINLSAGTHTVFCSAPAVFLSGLAPKSGKLSQFAATTSSELAGVVSDETGSGALVFATSPTLTTPNIGVATATSVNGTTIPSSKTLVVTTDKLSALAATTSAELAGVISDETGSGSLVFATSPSLTTPNIGTPSAGTLTNCMGLPVGGVSGLGTGVGTALAVNTGSAGAFVVNGGALGTPSSGTVTNLTGTASININGTVGATTPTTGAFTSLTASGDLTVDTNTLFVDSTNNRVGIGTTSPSAALNISVSSNDLVRVSGGGTFPTLAANDRIATVGNISGGDSNGIQVISGSVGSAYVGFGDGSDASQGFVKYDNNADALLLGANASERARINSSGNLGISTASPAEKLDVIGKVKAQAAATQDAVLLAGRAGGTSSYGVTVTPTTLTASRTFTLPDADGTALYDGGPLGTPSSGTVTNLTGTASININGTVGATTPNTGSFTTLAASSTVSGTGFSTYLASPPAIGSTAANTGAFTTLSASGVATFSAGTVTAPAITTTGDTNTGEYFPAADTIAWTTGGTERVRITSAGDVGIGGTPNNYAGQTCLTINNASGYSRVDLNIGGVKKSSIYGEGSSNMMFETAGSERMRIDSSGNVGIGTSSPAAKLDLSTGAGVKLFTYKDGGANAGIGTDLSGSGYECSIFAGGTSDSNGVISFGRRRADTGTYTERMRVDSSGSLCVGTTSDGATGTNTGIWIRGNIATVQVSRTSDPCMNLFRLSTDGAIATFSKGSTEVGTISVTGSATAYNTSSDRRLKENIVPSGNAKDILDAIQIVQHDWKAGGHTRFGVVAQDLNEVYPEAVSVGDDGETINQTWGVDYSKLVPLLTKAIQEQQQQIDALKAEVAALKGNA